MATSKLTVLESPEIMDAVLNDGLTTVQSSSLLFASADTIQSVAGKFFQVSLFPYLIFLYFLRFRGNRSKSLVLFGFQYLLIFVAAGIFGGVISEAKYDLILADTDWLHGASEALLTVSNILIVFGFRNAFVYLGPPESENILRKFAFLCATLFACLLAITNIFGMPEPHARFLWGLGDLPILPASTIPVNALSIPTWMIHFSSFYEFLFAMDLVWKYSKVTENETWKGLTWAMLPLHGGSVMAITFHFFHNDPSLQFLILLQGVLTLVGNATLAWATYRIATSNGWTVDEVGFALAPSRSSVGLRGIQGDWMALQPLKLLDPKDRGADTDGVVVFKLLALTIISSYVAKYGLSDFSQSNPLLALAIVLLVPAFTTAYFYNRSQMEKQLNYADKKKGF